MIETKRLELIPLTPSQLKLWIEDISVLEKAQKDPDNNTWHSFWILIRKIERFL